MGLSVHFPRRLSHLCVIASACLAAPGAQAIDWSAIPGKEVVLFYPAQMSWEMMLTEDEHSGADKFLEGRDCRACHEGEERASGMLLVADSSLDNAPIPDKPPFVEAMVKSAHDNERLYINVTFDAGDQPNAGQDADFPTKVAVMLSDGTVPEARRAGCWATCHDNLARMPSGEGAETTKYLARSRTGMSRQGSDSVKPELDLQTLWDSGYYLEYWQARLKPAAPPDVIDGFVLAERTLSENPAVTAEATQESGVWSVTFSRPLAAAGRYKDFSAGTTYTVGLSIHAGHTAQRYHYVSLEKTLVLGDGDADFVAQAQGGP